MTTQNYFIVENNVVTNTIVWDGDTNTWQPPVDATMLIQETTPAMIWIFTASEKDYVLTQRIGAGDIGFTWDGSVLTTNQPKPILPVASNNQPITTGTTTA